MLSNYSLTMKTCHKQKYGNSYYSCGINFASSTTFDITCSMETGFLMCETNSLEIKNPNVFMGNCSMIMGEVEQLKNMRKACDDKV